MPIISLSFSTPRHGLQSVGKSTQLTKVELYIICCLQEYDIVGKQNQDARGRKSASARHQQHSTYSFYNNDNDTGSSDGSESEYEAVGEDFEDVEEQLHEPGTRIQQATFENETEAQRRKERRHEKRAREREGDQRHRAGLPRHYLLVDPISQLPYGCGVGAWTKEMKLLSRKLDPAIGVINKQPHDALLEIADWIQHTWEYQHPLKWEFLKATIARGVSLRRAELWKKIRMNDPKPDDVSDRTWRSLKRELQNPATIKKQEDCSRANASRMNFGRTGPSGEVGVRARLRKRLRRSPDPEEVQLEMSRDKGYGGRSKKQKVQDNVMHDTDSALMLPFQVASVSDTCKDTNEERSNDEEYHTTARGSEDANQYMSANRAPPATLNTGSGGGNNISTEDLSSNPIVMKLLERIAALEGRQSSGSVTGTTMGPVGVQVPEASNIHEKNLQINAPREEVSNVQYRCSVSCLFNHFSKRVDSLTILCLLFEVRVMRLYKTSSWIESSKILK